MFVLSADTERHWPPPTHPSTWPGVDATADLLPPWPRRQRLCVPTKDRSDGSPRGMWSPGSATGAAMDTMLVRQPLSPGSSTVMLRAARLSRPLIGAPRRATMSRSANAAMRERVVGAGHDEALDSGPAEHFCKVKQCSVGVIRTSSAIDEAHSRACKGCAMCAVERAVPGRDRLRPGACQAQEGVGEGAHVPVAGIDVIEVPQQCLPRRERRGVRKGPGHCLKLHPATDSSEHGRRRVLRARPVRWRLRCPARDAGEAGDSASRCCARRAAGCPAAAR